jgi:hypothetical protein
MVDNTKKLLFHSNKIQLKKQKCSVTRFALEIVFESQNEIQRNHSKSAQLAAVSTSVKEFDTLFEQQTTTDEREIG